MGAVGEMGAGGRAGVDGEAGDVDGEAGEVDGEAGEVDGEAGEEGEGNTTVPPSTRTCTSGRTAVLPHRPVGHMEEADASMVTATSFRAAWENEAACMVATTVVVPST